jgi:hypothetical protein
MSTLRTTSRRFTRFAALGVAGGALLLAGLPLLGEATQERDEPPKSAERERSAPSSRPHPRVGGPLFPRLRPESNSAQPKRDNSGPGAELLQMNEGELREFVQFLAQHMPYTVGALRDKPIDASESQQEIVRSLVANRANVEKRRWLAAAAIFQFRRYNRGKRDFPDLTNQYLQDVKDTDDMVGLLIQYRQADEAKREQLKPELRTKLQTVARSMLDERRRRIQKLRESLEKEEAQLARDESRLDEGVDRKLEEMLTRTLAAPPPSSPPSGSNTAETASPSTTQPTQ